MTINRVVRLSIFRNIEKVIDADSLEGIDIFISTSLCQSAGLYSLHPLSYRAYCF